MYVVVVSSIHCHEHWQKKENAVVLQQITLATAHNDFDCEIKTAMFPKVEAGYAQEEVTVRARGRLVVVVQCLVPA